MTEIRVTYSGLIAFVIGIISVISGLVVTVVITRSLTSFEYGTWTLILNLIGYVIILEPIISYWSTREIARKTESGTTAVLSSGIFSCLGILIYLIILTVVVMQTDASFDIMFYAIILVPIIFINRTLTAINLGFKPHVASYGVLAYSLVQIPAIFLFLNYLELGVIGVIISSFSGYSISVLVLFIYGKERLYKNFNFKFIKKWFKLSWLTLYPVTFSSISLMDVTAFSIITGSVIGISYWGASMVIPIIIAQAASISYAIYPKILGGGKNDFVKDNFSLLFYFAIPLVAISIVFAEPALFTLNPIYVIAVPVVIITSFFVFFNMLNTTFYTALLGIEKVDIGEGSTFKDYLKSKLFHLPTVLLIQYSIYIVTLTISIVFAMTNEFSDIELVIIWSIVALLTHSPFTFYFYYLIKRDLSISLDYFRIIKFLLLSIFSFGISYILVENYLDYDVSLVYFIITIIGILLIGIGSYLTLTYVTDSKTRELFKSIISRNT